MSLKRAYRPPRVVLYTGHAGPLLTVAAALAGVDAVADKAAPERELLQAVRDAVRDRPPLEVPVSARRHAAERIDAADHAILAMRLERTSWSDIAQTLGVPITTVVDRAAAIVGRLAAAGSRDATPALAG